MLTQAGQGGLCVIGVNSLSLFGIVAVGSISLASWDA